MRYLLIPGGILAIALTLLAPATDAVARNSYQTTFNDLYGTASTRLDDCGVCHLDSRGGGRGNDYYAAWIGAGGMMNPAAAYRAIEDQDSDRDGSGNLVEIQQLFHPGYSCESYTTAVNAPADLMEYVDPNDVGCGPALGPQIEVSPVSLDFGAVELGSAVDLTLRARNVGDAVLTIQSASLNAGAEYGLQGPTGPFGLAPGTEQSWTIRYTPIDEGTDAGSFVLLSDDTDTSTSTVALSGSGFNPPSIEALDLDIMSLRVTKRVRIERDPAVQITVVVKNRSSVDGQTRPAILRGMQNGAVVYTETQDVYDDVGRGRTRFRFGPYFATTAGNLDWSLELDDDDPDEDLATASTLVLSSSTMAGASLTGAELRGEVLRGIDLSNADLRGADLSACDLSHVRGLDTMLSDSSTRYSAATRFTGTDFDPVAAGWTLVEESSAETESSFGRVKALFNTQ